jgi:protocatechuate 3,4-dioxygenase beta subunit
MSSQRPRTFRAAALGALMLGLLGSPFLISSADDQAQSNKRSSEKQPAKLPAAVLRGRVTDEKGKPLADVRVRVAIPATDMRFVDPSTPHKQLGAKTDAKGEYRLEMPGVTESTPVSIDAMKPGYRRLVGTLMAGGDARTVEVEPGGTAKADLLLDPSLYFAGRVVDEDGKPIAGVKISANLQIDNGSGGVERTASDAEGAFELFNYFLRPAVFGRKDSRGAVAFTHEGYIASEIKDVYALPPIQRESLRIVLKSGRKISGTVLDVAGNPVSHAFVKAMGPYRASRKATLSDAQGKFLLQGLKDGPTTLTALAFAIKQKNQLTIDLDRDRQDLQVQLRAMSLPTDLKKYEVLGMQLAEVTPELRSAYDLFRVPGVLILDPGKNSERLGIGQLAEGHVFFVVGEDRVRSVREFVKKILALATDEKNAQRHVRVVYTFSTVEFDGSNTQFLKLTDDDLVGLRRVLDQFVAEDQATVLALSKAGAQFTFKPAGPASEPDQRHAGREVDSIIIGKKWKGSEEDLHLVLTLPAFRGLSVRGAGKVSDKALDELRKARPDIHVERVSEAYFGAEFGREKAPQPKVVGVLPNSPAARAGLKAGDVLVEFAGKPVADLTTFRVLMIPLKPGQKVGVKLKRGDATLPVAVEMGTWD